MKKYKFISVGTLKGGVGKSTIAVTLACMLAEQGNSTLIIDSDPQGNSSCYLGLNEDKEGYKSLFDIYSDKNADAATVVQHTEVKNLDIIGSTIYLTALERSFSTISFAEMQLKRFLDKNEEFFNKYDYIIADTNPSMSKLNQNVFCVSDKIISVTDVGIGALRGVNLFSSLLQELSESANLDIKIDAILVNRCKSNTTIAKDYLNFLREDDSLKDILLKQVVSESVKWSKCELEGKPITHFKSSKGYKEFKAVFDELKERGIL